MEFPEYNLRLTITSTSPNNVQITLENTNYSARKSKTFRCITYVVCLYFIYFVILNGKHFLIHAAFLVILMLLTAQLLSIVDKEILSFDRDFGVEKRTVVTFGRSSAMFIPINNIHQFVLNEVIYFVSANDLDDFISTTD